MDEIKSVSKKNKGSLLLTIIIGIACLGIGFFGGMQYQKSQKVNLPSGMQAGFPNGSGAPGTGTNGRAGTKGTGNQPINGEITGIDNGSITVKTQDGGSKIVVLSSSTKISIATVGSTSDLKTGDSVMIIGTTDSSGTLTAQTVSIGTTGLQFQGGMEQPPSGN